MSHSKFSGCESKMHFWSMRQILAELKSKDIFSKEKKQKSKKQKIKSEANFCSRNQYWCKIFELFFGFSEYASRIWHIVIIRNSVAIYCSKSKGSSIFKIIRFCPGRIYNIVESQFIKAELKTALRLSTIEDHSILPKNL